MSLPDRDSLWRLSEDELGAVAAEAVRELLDSCSDEAEAVVAVIALQHPEALTPLLESLWQVSKPVRWEGAADSAVDFFYMQTAWRGADDAAVQALLRRLDSGDRKERTRAWNCLLETRRVVAWDAARESLAEIEQDWSPEFAQYPWWHVAVEPGEQGWRALAPARCWHLQVEHDQPAPWLDHPTWHLATPTAPVATFGGLSEGVCPEGHGPLRRLLLLDPPPHGCGVTLARLDLAYCRTCTDGWEPSFFRHDSRGVPTPVRTSSGGLGFDWEETSPSRVVRLARTPRRWTVQHEMWTSLENRSRLGGEPTWIQSPGYEQCPECLQTMPFLVQFDWCSLPGGEGGITYLSWCDGCRISALSYQTS